MARRQLDMIIRLAKVAGTQAHTRVAAGFLSAEGFMSWLDVGDFADELTLNPKPP